MQVGTIDDSGEVVEPSGPAITGTSGTGISGTGSGTGTGPGIGPGIGPSGIGGIVPDLTGSEDDNGLPDLGDLEVQPTGDYESGFGPEDDVEHTTIGISPEAGFFPEELATFPDQPASPIPDHPCQKDPR